MTFSFFFYLVILFILLIENSNAAYNRVKFINNGNEFDVDYTQASFISKKNITAPLSFIKTKKPCDFEKEKIIQVRK